MCVCVRERSAAALAAEEPFKLQDLNFSVKKGQLVAIVGSVGYVEVLSARERVSLNMCVRACDCGVLNC